MYTDTKAWLVSADMGYGHQRAIFPISYLSKNGILTVGSSEATSKTESKLWKRILNTYEFFSRAKSIPVIGTPFFSIWDAMMRIPSFYPIRNMSNTTFQVNLLESAIKGGLCSGMLETIKTDFLPLVTSFYAPAVAADMNGYHKIYCIICDADINRVWVAKEPWESRIEYFVPCGKAAQRLKLYGVPEDRIHYTGFPLPTELLGNENLSVLKNNLLRRLHHLDPEKRFRLRHGRNVDFYLGESNDKSENRVLTISYSVGGAGAQKEIGAKIAYSLKDKIQRGEVQLNLIAGIKKPVLDFFNRVKKDIAPGSDFIQVIYSDSLEKYFELFNSILKDTDILWTKPSELSFYSALGLPIIMSPSIGSQENFNKKWLLETGAGIKQLNPDYTDQWLFQLLRKGILAEAAWNGFLKVRKLGTYKIREVLENGRLNKESSPVIR
ncbi:MAG: hypothetical protein PVF17_04180 [Ignavibacteria bacterium]|jgi:hypothetical protein